MTQIVKVPDRYTSSVSATFGKTSTRSPQPVTNSSVRRTFDVRVVSDLGKVPTTIDQSEIVEQLQSDGHHRDGMYCMVTFNGQVICTDEAEQLLYSEDEFAPLKPL